ncbi:acyl carrier protein [Candidatus Pacearchaeota archaeon]|nr:hypothetical protein [uncultured archaeon]MBS3076650.1 acyl carrier protein [Candidatus Pacearchaeota archaeon]
METLKKIVAKTLAVKEGEIELASSPKNLSSWDSFNSFMIISEIESNFNVKLSSSDIMTIETVKDIVETLRRLNVEEKFLVI